MNYSRFAYFLLIYKLIFTKKDYPRRTIFLFFLHENQLAYWHIIKLAHSYFSFLINFYLLFPLKFLPVSLWLTCLVCRFISSAKVIRAADFGKVKPSRVFDKISTPHSSGSIFPKNLAFASALPFYGPRNEINILRALDA